MKNLVNESGITVRQLKELVKDLPEKDHEDSDYEVWVSTEDTLSSPAVMIGRLNKGDLIVEPMRHTSKWLSVKEVPPIKGKDYLFIIESIIKLMNGKVLAGRYQGNNNFSVVGTVFRATKYQSLPKNDDL